MNIIEIHRSDGQTLRWLVDSDEDTELITECVVTVVDLSMLN